MVHSFADKIGNSPRGRNERDSRQVLQKYPCCRELRGFCAMHQGIIPEQTRLLCRSNISSLL
jgi:hypothetical protein